MRSSSCSARGSNGTSRMPAAAAEEVGVEAIAIDAEPTCHILRNRLVLRRFPVRLQRLREKPDQRPLRRVPPQPTLVDALDGAGDDIGRHDVESGPSLVRDAQVYEVHDAGDLVLVELTIRRIDYALVRRERTDRRSQV